MGNGHSPSNDEQSSSIAAIRSELERALGDQSFSSEQELQDAVAQKVAELNQSPVSDFQGLSREQMHRLLHAPFDAPDLVRFAEGIEARPAATAFRLLEVIVDAAGSRRPAQRRSAFARASGRRSTTRCSRPTAVSSTGPMPMGGPI